MSLDDKIKELDEIDALRSVYHGAYAAALDAGKDRREADRDGFRAILSVLASKGVDGMPDVDDLAGELRKHKPGAGIAAEVALEYVSARIALIFAVKDAERDALRAELADAKREGAGWEVAQATGERLSAVHRALDAANVPDNPLPGGSPHSRQRADHRILAVVQERDALRARVAELEAALATAPCGPEPPPVVRWRVEFTTGAYYTMATTIDRAIAQARKGFGDGCAVAAARLDGEP